MSRPWERWDEPGVADAIESYWQASELEARHRQQLAAFCRPYLGREASVLEVGCGSGRVYEQLVPALVADDRYHGIDVSQRMLAIARRRHPRGRFDHGDGHHLAFAADSFDVVVAFEVLGHLPDVVPLLREMVRVARRAVLFTAWWCADGIEDDAETVCGARFLHRRYSEAAMREQVQLALPGTTLELAVTTLGNDDMRAYALSRPAPPAAQR